MGNYSAGMKAKCPHCQTVVLFTIPDYGESEIRYSSNVEVLNVSVSQCPSCNRLVIGIAHAEPTGQGGWRTRGQYLLWPFSSGRPPAPTEVPENIANDYDQASMILDFCPQASAALSRRCLQTILTTAGGAKSDNLSKQIDEVSPSLPSHIRENLHYIREIGNFAAHQQKSKNSGEILDVEPGEAEWSLDVLDSLFDFYYVGPTREKRKKAAFDEKLSEAGKKPIS